MRCQGCVDGNTGRKVARSQVGRLLEEVKVFSAVTLVGRKRHEESVCTLNDSQRHSQQLSKNQSLCSQKQLCFALLRLRHAGRSRIWDKMSAESFMVTRSYQTRATAEKENIWHYSRHAMMFFLRKIHAEQL